MLPCESAVPWGCRSPGCSLYSAGELFHSEKPDPEHGGALLSRSLTPVRREMLSSVKSANLSAGEGSGPGRANPHPDTDGFPTTQPAGCRPPHPASETRTRNEIGVLLL